MSNWARLLAVCGVALALLAPASAAPAALHLGARARRHIQEGHFPGGRRTAGTSLFNKGEALDALIAASATAGSSASTTWAGPWASTTEPVRLCPPSS
jgi:hypothetical protein